MSTQDTKIEQTAGKGLSPLDNLQVQFLTNKKEVPYVNKLKNSSSILFTELPTHRTKHKHGSGGKREKRKRSKLDSNNYTLDGCNSSSWRYPTHTTPFPCNPSGTFPFSQSTVGLCPLSSRNSTSFSNGCTGTTTLSELPGNQYSKNTKIQNGFHLPPMDLRCTQFYPLNHPGLNPFPYYNRQQSSSCYFEGTTRQPVTSSYESRQSEQLNSQPYLIQRKGFKSGDNVSERSASSSNSSTVDSSRDVEMNGLQEPQQTIDCSNSYSLLGSPGILGKNKHAFNQVETLRQKQGYGFIRPNTARNHPNRHSTCFAPDTLNIFKNASASFPVSYPQLSSQYLKSGCSPHDLYQSYPFVFTPQQVSLQASSSLAYQTLQPASATMKNHKKKKRKEKEPGSILNKTNGNLAFQHGNITDSQLVMNSSYRSQPSSASDYYSFPFSNQPNINNCTHINNLTTVCIPIDQQNNPLLQYNHANSLYSTHSYPSVPVAALQTIFNPLVQSNLDINRHSKKKPDSSLGTKDTGRSQTVENFSLSQKNDSHISASSNGSSEISIIHPYDGMESERSRKVGNNKIKNVGRLCKVSGCRKLGIGPLKKCVSHGGGRRCQYEGGCDKGASGNTDLCVKHGGGIRCNVDGCEKKAQGKAGKCKGHGGGYRCQYPSCVKSAQDTTPYCIAHGGGTRCRVPYCNRSARGKSGLCVSHGGGKRCVFENCTKAAANNSKYCSFHREEGHVFEPVSKQLHNNSTRLTLPFTEAEFDRNLMSDMESSVSSPKKTKQLI